MAFFGKSIPTTSVPKDIEVVAPPSDSVSRVAFSPVADLLAVSSWNNEVRIYDVGPNGETQPRGMYTHDGPVLDLSWSSDGEMLLSASADRTAKAFHVQTQQAMQVAAHDDAVSAIRWIQTPTSAFIATASWDKTLKYWTVGNPSPIASIQLPERCYAMDAVYPTLVLGLAGNEAAERVLVINLTNPTEIAKRYVSPLKKETRSIAIFPDGSGWAMGSSEGRLAIQYVSEAERKNNYSFRCHRVEDKPRKQVDVYALNNICFHKEQGTFVTCGSDGTMSSWDHRSKMKIKLYDNLGGPVVSASYNRTGKLLAYAVAYDWSKGYSGMTINHTNKVFIHICSEQDVSRRPARS
ncbi:WD40 repeat-like protein [Clavulina sp. PMI_390]|nr:WD40 repeat-like protein [Clavulina sp. PMI_390]